MKITIFTSNAAIFASMKSLAALSNHSLEYVDKFSGYNGVCDAMIIDFDHIDITVAALRDYLNTKKKHILCTSKEDEMLDQLRPLDVTVEHKPLTNNKINDFIGLILAELPSGYFLCKDADCIYDKNGHELHPLLNASSLDSGFLKSHIKQAAKNITGEDEFMKKLGLDDIKPLKREYSDMKKRDNTIDIKPNDSLLKYRIAKLQQLNISPLEIQKRILELTNTAQNRPDDYREKQRYMLEKLKTKNLSEITEKEEITFKKVKTTSPYVQGQNITEINDPEMEEIRRKRKIAQEESRKNYIETSMFRKTEDESKYFNTVEADTDYVTELSKNESIQDTEKPATKEMSLLERAKNILAVRSKPTAQNKKAGPSRK